MESLRAKDWAPRSVRRRAREIADVTARLEYLLGRPPTETEIADELGVDIEAYHKALEEISGATLLSLEEALSVDEDDRDVDAPDLHPHDEFADPAFQLQEEDTRRVLVGAVERLPEREKQVIGLYYQDEMTLKEIGAVLGVTESRVCQIHSQAIARLRGIAAREFAMAVPR